MLEVILPHCCWQGTSYIILVLLQRLGPTKSVGPIYVCDGFEATTAKMDPKCVLGSLSRLQHPHCSSNPSDILRTYIMGGPGVQCSAKFRLNSTRWQTLSTEKITSFHFLFQRKWGIAWGKEHLVSMPSLVWWGSPWRMGQKDPNHLTFHTLNYHVTAESCTRIKASTEAQHEGHTPNIGNKMELPQLI